MAPPANAGADPSGRTGAQIHELEALTRLANELIAMRSKLDGLIAARNREMLRACDHYSLRVEDVAEASGLTPQRANQIFSEMSK